jgi:hypothetical protein
MHRYQKKMCTLVVFRTGGMTLKGIRCISNQLMASSNNKEATVF